MGIMNAEFTSRLKHWIRTLREDFYHPLSDLHFEGFFTIAHIPYTEALQYAFAPIPAGTGWGESYQYLWLKCNIVLPAESADHIIAMDLSGFGSEATLFVNGEAFGTYRADWLKVRHHYMVDNVLTFKAVAGTAYELLFEVYAGHFFPGLDNCATGPVLPGSFLNPKAEGARCILNRCTYGFWYEEAYQLYMDVAALESLLGSIPDSSLRAARIADALEKFTLTVDFEQPAEGRMRDYRAARDLLAPCLKAQNGDTVPRMYAIGNAHIDLAWLWPMAETHRKTARTFAAQLRLLDLYPEYKYLQSQPAAYTMCREFYPALYKRVKAAIKNGRWIAEGAMYVEPDTNMTSGESLIRQIVHGKRFFREEFGVESRLLWLPDTFGYSSVLPQILKGCGVDYLVTQKIFWTYNDGDRFPYHYFTWKGMDGSKVDSFLPTSYTYTTDPAQLCGVWDNRVQKRNLDSFLIPFGYGDGGGGPCRDHIEYILREKDLEGMPKVEMTSPSVMFADLEKAGGPADTWEGELYFSAHRGTYTSQAAVKKNNRRGELALREAEAWGAIAACRGYTYPLLSMDGLWKTLLLHQFHDILPGSSIARVYQEALAAHEKLIRSAEEITASAQSFLTSGKGVTVFNSLSWERTGLVRLPDEFGGGASYLDGTAVPVIKTGGQTIARVTVPSLGAVSLIPAAYSPADVGARAFFRDEDIMLENDIVRVILNRQGEILSYVRKDSGREFAAAPMNRLCLFKDVPRAYDAWDVDSNYAAQPVPLSREVVMEVTEEAGIRASVRVTRKIGNSDLKQTISLEEHSECVEFTTEMNWQELHRLLKVSFPCDVEADEAYHEMQFGYIKRPTHRSRAYDKDRFEVCNHRYTALCDGSHGCAVLNNGKYGVSVNGGSIELSLLRAPAAPEMRADNGMQSFTYAFTAWEGEFASCRVVRRGYELNVPFTLAPGQTPAFSLFAIDHENIILDTLKPAEDGSGDMILRLYESKHADTRFELKTSLAVSKASLCDMLENELSSVCLSDGGMTLHAGPFKVLTVRLRLKQPRSLFPYTGILVSSLKDYHNTEVHT
jgi:alpha-mannosidase